MSAIDEESFGVTYFNGLNGRNTKITVASVNDRIVTLLLCGWSINDLLSCAKHKTVLGMHPTITTEAISDFIKVNGSSLNVVSMALNRNQPNTKAFESVRKTPTEVGHIQMDFGEWDFLDTLQVGDKRRKKLPSFGGALMFCIWTDEFSGYPQGKLMKSTKNALEVVKVAIQGLRRDGHTALILEDTGIKYKKKFLYFV